MLVSGRPKRKHAGPFFTVLVVPVTFFPSNIHVYLLGYLKITK